MDYTYQHSIFFQYTYGSAACLFYLTVVNLAELPRVWNRPALAATAALLAGVCFCGNILPLSENYVNRYFNYRAVWQETDAVLDRIPDDASVAATTFLTVPLSRRAVLYDLRYCSQEHLLSTDYVVVETTDSGSLKPYAVDGEDGLEGLTALLRAAGYAQLPDTGSRVQRWKRPSRPEYPADRPVEPFQCGTPQVDFWYICRLVKLGGEWYTGSARKDFSGRTGGGTE